MKASKVIKVSSEGLELDNGLTLSSYHQSDCCERHELTFTDLSLSDFDGLEFDLSGEDFFRRIPDYGIELIPISGFSVKIPGHGSNNGYYSSNLDLVLEGNNFRKTFDISACQTIIEC